MQGEYLDAALGNHGPYNATEAAALLEKVMERGQEIGAVVREVCAYSREVFEEEVGRRRELGGGRSPEAGIGGLGAGGIEARLEAAGRVQRAYQQYSGLRREAVLSVLGGEREMGAATPRWAKGSARRVRAEIDRACAYFPAEWIRGGREAPMHGSPSKKSHYSSGRSAAGLRPSDAPSIALNPEAADIAGDSGGLAVKVSADAVHEVCHYAEDALAWMYSAPAWSAASDSAYAEFEALMNEGRYREARLLYLKRIDSRSYGQRIKGGPLRAVQQAFLAERGRVWGGEAVSAGGEHRHSEITYPFEIPDLGFPEPYAGYSYPDGSAETLAVGYEALLSGELDNLRLAAEGNPDTDHQDFCLGCLAVL